jgi:D-amino-acid dehydrogenase
MNDVIVIGGGVVGLCCAWHLREAGMAVTVLDRGDYTDGCSYANAGMVTPSHFIPLASPGIMAKGLAWMLNARSPFYIRPRLDTALVRWLWLFASSANARHVERSAPLLRDMSTDSRDWYAALQDLLGHDIGYSRKGIIMLFRSPGAERGEVETAALARELGIEANVLTSDALQALDPGCTFSVMGGVHYPGDAHLIPHVLMSKLKTGLEDMGVTLMARHPVTRIDDRDASGAEVVLATGERMRARHVVVASGVWSSALAAGSRRKMPLQDGKGYSVTVPLPDNGPSVPAILHEARVAITPMGDRLRIGGTLEISGLDDVVRKAKVDGILSAVPDYYPDLRVADPGPVWFGYRPCTPDGLPYIGRMRPASAVIVAAGHAMMGTSLAPATGRLVTEMITGKALTYDTSLLRPDRFGG